MTKEIVLDLETHPSFVPLLQDFGGFRCYASYYSIFGEKGTRTC